MNPMGKEHVSALLDDLLAMDADAIAAQAVADASAELANEPGTFKVGMAVADDLKGGWTNRYAAEYAHRFPTGPLRRAERNYQGGRKTSGSRAFSGAANPPRAQRPRSHSHGRVPDSVYSTARLRRHAARPPAQEGHVMARAGCIGPVLNAEEIAATRRSADAIPR